MKKLNLISQVEMPILGFGTWQLRGANGRKAIEKALEIGYRHIDTADFYENHEIIGEAIISSEIPRENLFIVTKIYPPALRRQNVLKYTNRYLDELQTNFIDLLLIHWPGRTPIEETLGAMEEMKERGLIRVYGVSNFDRNDIEDAIKAGFKPANNQIEYHLDSRTDELVNYCRAKEITITAYSPLSEGKVIKNPLLIELAKKINVTPAQLALKWIMNKNIAVIPKASSEKHMRENFESLNVEIPRQIFEELDSSK